MEEEVRVGQATEWAISRVWLDLGMADWASLRDAYGSAEGVPDLLAAAAASSSEDDGLWDELWGRLCHQGTVYSASYAALPKLAEIAGNHEPSGYVAALHLAAAIIASTDAPEDAALVRRRYDRELTELRTIAARNLRFTNGYIEFVYGLQALMAFEDGGVWQRNLDCLADGEASFECPTCREDLLLDLDSPEFRVASFADASTTPRPVTPSEPAATTVEGRLLALARHHDQDAAAASLPYLFGGSSCPHCHASFEIAQALM